MNRARFVNAPEPPLRVPWALGSAALALVIYGGAVLSDFNKPAAAAVFVRPQRPQIAAPAVQASAAPLALPASIGPALHGRASWYGPGLHGLRTASGERFDMHDLTAAHRTLPLGSYAQVKNLSNGRTVVVRINDRGPQLRRRAIDLSYAAAEELRMVGAGTANVEIAPLAN
ncbi:MAG TPA: septal ring lytic transglycosylase RlpA family protein [Thermoanaerobaculia bacterium]|nr:septal ring lytic transglycosylase RlpA family protein [Thermoanaerobaculia bacterium]